MPQNAETLIDRLRREKERKEVCIVIAMINVQEEREMLITMKITEVTDEEDNEDDDEGDENEAKSVRVCVNSTK